MRRLLFLALGLAVLGPALPAQETEDRAPISWFRLITRDPDLARRVAALFGVEPATFELEGSERAVFDARVDGSFEQREMPAGGHPKAWAELFVRTVEMLPRFRKEHAAELARTAVQADFAMQAAGYPKGFGKELLDDVLELVESIPGAYLRIEGDPRALAEGLTVFLDLVPEPKTALHDWVRALAPNARGAPVPPVPDAPVTLRLSLNQDSLFHLLAPFTDLVCKRGAKTDEDEERNRAFFDAGLRTLDGTLSGSFDGEHIVGHTGLRDPEAAASLFADEQYRDWLQENAEAGPGVEAEVRPAALEHRGVALLKTTVDSAVPNALMPEGVSIGYRGVAGDYELSIGGASADEAAVKAAVDRLLDGEPKRSELPDSGILVLDLDLRRLAGMLPAELGQLLPPREAIPDNARLLLHKIGITVKLRLELK